MALRVYNTLTRQKEEPFKTVQPGRVSMYVCGPTVYKPSHVGHMVGPVIFETVKRYLTYLGYQVTLVINITDIDDKIIKRSIETGKNLKAYTEPFTACFFEDCERLRIQKPDVITPATDYTYPFMAEE